MSRLAVPVLERVLYSTGDVLLRVELDLLVKTNQGSWVRQTFLVDTGSETNTFPASDARTFDLPIPINLSLGPVHAQTGLTVRSGLLRFRVVGMDQTEYVTACFFLGDPNAPYTGPTANAPRKLFQPLGVIKQLRFTFDDTQQPGILYGEMIIEKK